MAAKLALGHLPVVAIVGRPNVGKSTLFNRLIRRRKALVFDEAGSTRDYLYAEARFGNLAAMLVDTGGLEEDAERGGGSRFSRSIFESVNRFLKAHADVILMLFDGKEGLTAADRTLAQRLRKLGKPILFVVNKIDGPQKASEVDSFYDLGKTILTISAEHGIGIQDLETALEKTVLGQATKEKPQVADAAQTEPEFESDHLIKIAIVGRPNVGKSTLMNFLLGEERALVNDEPGTTRDPVEGVFIYKKKPYQIVDTAGVRRKGKTLGKEGIEGLSVIQTLKAIEEAYIVILVLDLSEGVTEQDAKVAGLVQERGRGLLIFANKVDRYLEKRRRDTGKGNPTPQKLQKELEEEIYWHMPFLRYAPIVIGSALKGSFREERFFALLRQIEKARHLEIPTTELNRYIEGILRDQPLPIRKGKRLKLYYMTQALARNVLAPDNEEDGAKGRLRPATPKFVCFVNAPKSVHYSDERFLINCLRKRYSFIGNAIDLEFRGHRELEK